MNYADTNWLEAVYISPHPDDREGQVRERVQLGTFDAAIVASAKLAGGTRFLSFDSTPKALAVVEGLDVFPPLDAQAKRIVSALKG